MFRCPHCDQPINLAPTIQSPPESVWVSLTRKPVSLGCGSLLAIAIIVAVCSGVSNRGVSEVRSDIRNLYDKIESLEQLVLELKVEDVAVGPVMEAPE